MDLINSQIAIDLIVKMETVKNILKRVQDSTAPVETVGGIRFRRVTPIEGGVELKLTEKDLTDELERLKEEFKKL
jgi:hypothetical protein